MGRKTEVMECSIGRVKLISALSNGIGDDFISRVVNGKVKKFEQGKTDKVLSLLHANNEALMLEALALLIERTDDCNERR